MEATKTCARCGREIVWRKKWAKDWDSVRWCSEACRRSKLTSQDHALEAALLALLDQRPRGATICPSEVARQVGGEAWRDLMEPVRSAARRLVDQGTVSILQGGHVVDPSTAKGPIRIRKRP